jgi:hypothetical protein
LRLLSSFPGVGLLLLLHAGHYYKVDSPTPSNSWLPKPHLYCYVLHFVNISGRAVVILLTNFWRAFFSEQLRMLFECLCANTLFRYPVSDLFSTLLDM